MRPWSAAQLKTYSVCAACPAPIVWLRDWQKLVAGKQEPEPWVQVFHGFSLLVNHIDSEMMNAQCSSTSQCLVPDGSCCHSLCNWHKREPDVVLQVHIHFSNFLDLDQETIFCILVLYSNIIVIYCSVLHNLKLWFCWLHCSNSDNMFTSSLLTCYKYKLFWAFEDTYCPNTYVSCYFPASDPFFGRPGKAHVILLQVCCNVAKLGLQPYGPMDEKFGTLNLEASPIPQESKKFQETKKLLSLWECHIT